jgi:hypothetical protein
LKMAELLGGGGLTDEARAALLEAVHPLACALAVENRFPEPANLEQSLLAPLSTCWQATLAPLRLFITDPNAPWKPVAELLAKT